MDWDDLEPMRKVKAPEITRWIERQYQPSNATLVIVGHVDPTVAIDLATEMFESWSTSQAPKPPPMSEPHSAPAVQRVVVFDEPSESQTSVHLRCTLPSGGLEVDAAQEVASLVLSDQVRGQLREAAGVTYGASASIRHWDNGYSQLNVQSTVQNDAAGLTVEVFRDAIADVAAGEIEDDTVRTMAWRHALSLAVGQETQVAMETRLINVISTDASWQSWKDYPATLGALQASDLGAVIGDCTKHQVVLLAGPASVIADQLTSRGIEHEVFDWRAAGIAELEERAPKAAKAAAKERASEGQ